MRKFVALGAVVVMGLGVAACRPGGPASGALTQAQQRQAMQESSSSSTATTMGANGTSSASVGTSTVAVTSGTSTSTVSVGTDTTGAPAATTASASATGGSADTAKGKQLFSATCAGCHTLSDAGSTGNVGPNLDQLKPTQTVVEQQIANGGGGMPAKLYTGQDATDVAAYVASVAGQ